MGVAIGASDAAAAAAFSTHQQSIGGDATDYLFQDGPDCSSSYSSHKQVLLLGCLSWSRVFVGHSMLHSADAVCCKID